MHKIVNPRRGFILALLVLIFFVIAGCATVPDYDGTNQAEIVKAKKFNKRAFWTVITVIAIAPYTIESSDRDIPCQSSKSCRN